MSFNSIISNFIILGCLMLFTLISCEKDSIFLPTEKRVQGKWKYEKVEFRKNFSLSKEEITADYKDLIIEFKGNNSIVQTSNVPNRDAIGKWEVKRLMLNNEEDQTTRFIKGHLTDVSSGHQNSFEWRNLQFTRRKMSFTERRDGGTYRFKLRKQ